jgi:LacI family transcriptional regulator
MPNQRDLARALGVNQATISLALRGDPSISPRMRRRVRDAAARLGYRPNAYVAMLMSRIRAGRKSGEQGVIALVVDARSEADWHRVQSYRIYQQGVAARAAELGFRSECFFLRAPGMNAATLDRIFQARGIKGIIMAPPYRGNRSLALDWSRYAGIGCGHGREAQQLDRVANDHAQNVLIAFHELAQLGYRRIGMCLGAGVAQSRGLKWMAGYLEAQAGLPARGRIPLFLDDGEDDILIHFRGWHKKWRPEVLLTLTGQEKRWLEAMKLRVPQDIGLACLVRQRGSGHAAIDEKNEVIGAAALELVVSQMTRNEYGPPLHPKLVLIEGQWVGGTSVIRKNAFSPPLPSREARK